MMCPLSFSPSPSDFSLLRLFLPPPPLTASLGDYDPETHKEGYTGEFEDFLLLPKNMRVCGYYGNITTLNYTVLTCKCTGKIQHLRRTF